MTTKELKRLSRSDLLEMLLELSKENETLQEQNTALRQKLRDRTIAIESCGSLAEAALKLNGFFQAAEDACAQYRENLLSRMEGLEAQCRSREEQTAQRCAAMEAQTRERCAAMEAEARQRCEALVQQAQLELESREEQWLQEIMNGGEIE